MNAISSGPASVLLIDHDQYSTDTVSQVLERSGYQCHCTNDFPSALRVAETLPLDLIVCDVRLEQINGMELCKELRALPGLDEVPVIYVSAAQIPDIVRRSHDAGGAYYLRKPVDPEVLLEIVAKALWMPHLINNRLRYEQGSTSHHPAGLGNHSRSNSRSATPWRRG